MVMVMIMIMIRMVIRMVILTFSNSLGFAVTFVLNQSK